MVQNEWSSGFDMASMCEFDSHRLVLCFGTLVFYVGRLLRSMEC